MGIKLGSTPSTCYIKLLYKLFVLLQYMLDSVCTIEPGGQDLAAKKASLILLIAIEDISNVRAKPVGV